MDITAIKILFWLPDIRPSEIRVCSHASVHSDSELKKLYNKAFYSPYGLQKIKYYIFRIMYFFLRSALIRSTFQEILFETIE